MDNEMVEKEVKLPEEASEQEAEVIPEEAKQPEQENEITALRGEVAELKLRLALLTAGASPEKLDEGVKLAAGILTAQGGEPETAAGEVLREYPHIKLTKRAIPKFSAESSGKGDGFAAIRSIFAKR